MKRFFALLLILFMTFSCTNVLEASVAASQKYITNTLKDEIIFEVSELIGTWTDSSLKNYNGQKTKFSNTKGDKVLYNISDIKAGNYEVYYWVIPQKKDNVGGFDVTIEHIDKKDVVTVLTKLDEGEEIAPGWFSVGVFDFSGNNSELVYASAPAGNVRATAVKFVPTDKSVTITEPRVEPEEIVKTATISGFTVVSNK